MTAERAYTRHGLRAHYRRPNTTNTYCDRITVPLASRNRLMQHVLPHASVCSRCEKLEELDSTPAFVPGPPRDY